MDKIQYIIQKYQLNKYKYPIKVTIRLEDDDTKLTITVKSPETLAKIILDIISLI